MTHEPGSTGPTPVAGDALVGLAARAARAGLSAGRVALAPARLVARVPPIDAALRRIDADLSHRGALERSRFVARGEELFAEPALERAMDHVLAGPLTDAMARSIAQNRVIERVAAEVIAETDLHSVLDAVLEDARTEALLERALGSPALERLLVQVLDSRLVDAITERVLASPEIERIVDFIASSPQVRDAVSQQTQSFAAEMADGVRRRTQSADDRAESLVRGWLHRPRPQTS